LPSCLFVSDLHGREHRCRKLLDLIEATPVDVVFLGGDLLPADLGGAASPDPFVEGFLEPEIGAIRRRLGPKMPKILIIPGNDDPRCREAAFLRAERRGAWTWMHRRRMEIAGYGVYGYACVPPTPFQLKDWERYDVSRYVDPGCVSPEEGVRTVPVTADAARYRTIAADLEALVGEVSMERAVFLFHSPPYRSQLDRAGLDGQTVDHVPIDVHVGSIAIQRFVERCQPMLTMHGHVHESPRLTGRWMDRIGRTVMLSAAHDGPELAVVRFDLEDVENATRELV